MCTNPRYISVAPSPVDYLRGNATKHQIPIPCGKCFECLAARQNSFMIRAYREAQKYGSMFHLTLTYDEKHLPVAESVWRTDTETGLMTQVDSPFVEFAKMTVINERHYPRYSKRVRKDGTCRRLKDKICYDSERVLIHLIVSFAFLIMNLRNMICLEYWSFLLMIFGRLSKMIFVRLLRPLHLLKIFKTGFGIVRMNTVIITVPFRISGICAFWNMVRILLGVRIGISY